MAKATFSRRTRATIFTATAGLSLAVALLPGGASAAPGDPAGRPAADSGAPAGSPAGDSPALIPSQQSLARSDARLTKAEQRPGVRQLRKQLGAQGVLELDPDTGTARQVARLDGYLTSASGATPEDIARRYLRAHPDVFGLTAAQVEGLTLRKQYTDVAGIRHLSFVQSVDGVPVFGNGVKANVARDGRLISVLGSPVRGLPSALAPAKITGKQARHNAVRDIAGGTDVSTGSSDTAKQVVYTTPDGAARRAWRTVTAPDGQGMWLHVVDAATGRVLYRQNLSSDLVAEKAGSSEKSASSAKDAGSASLSAGPLLRTGKVLVWDQYPGAKSGGKQHTRHLTARGWLPEGAQTLNGSVAHVFSDVNDNNEVDPGEEVTPGADGTFSFPFKPFTGDGCGTPLPCSWDQKTPNSWQTNREQNAAQVYYFIGTFHDHLEAGPIGFTRAAGNFDSRDGDAVQAQTDDGAAMKDGLPDDDHLNNANMGTPPDGQAPTMQMYLTGSIPGFNVLQGNFGDDAATVYHEYTHGLSHRLITDADGVPALNSEQSNAMGEAWSDWYALDFLNNEGLLKDNRRVDGDVNLDAPGWSDELPARSQSMDCPVGSTSAACHGTAKAGTGGYTYGDYGKISSRGPEVHGDGEIWGETLWDLRNTLGSRLTESLVTRAMELSPVSPSFLDQRNAILQADTVVNGGRAHDRIWKVFANRGMGWFAAALTGDDVLPDEDFSLPPGPNTPVVTLTGKVTDDASGAPVGGVTVSISGHASGFPGADLSAVSAADGTYAIRNVPEGTYRKVYASGNGYEPQIRTLTVAAGAADWSVRRNWSASSGGAEVAEFSGVDYSDFGCGPAGLIDMSANVWGSEANGGTNGTGVDPVHNTVRLPQGVDISELRVDPTSGCGDDVTASLGDYRIETSTDGTTWATAAEGHFGPADTGRENTVALNTGTAQNVRYVRVTMLGNQAVDNGVDCAQDSGSSGCQYMDMTELVVHGAPHQG
ncbi:M36 family metallopeptidase [Streptomyces turgidiscabies]|uniref:F5/8 type C domain protein n=1 Tax=Streptomyces turgidiscabies (strain Car8) TaxID=698760 RepID=L7EUT4_STRT8|nr:MULTISPECIES: M36 family metallopeptidase [Streptomyces]ELP62817.1 F5/8 type C domain protein [Streptomyces turgidiscabies Car8]MDX3493237.1 M36 family metallopeptidase [Streptomyces turgidiscabies]GAQ70538.1 thermolysin precursor [Streptomyces turgidiscabies]